MPQKHQEKTNLNQNVIELIMSFELITLILGILSMNTPVNIN